MAKSKILELYLNRRNCFDDENSQKATSVTMEDGTSTDEDTDEDDADYI